MRTLITGLILFAGMSAFAAEGDHWSAGSGLVGRLQEDVNPQYPDSEVLPHLFLQFRRGPYGASLEGEWQRQDTSSGALEITSKTLSLGLWGRYEFREPMHWSPFASLGAGAFFDTVTSKYFEELDQRNGRRGFLGAGGGISHCAWKHLLLEAEMRAALIQDRKDIAWTGILRLGFVL